VFVKYLPPDVNEDELKKVFEKAGNIISVKLVKSTKNVGGEEI